MHTAFPPTKAPNEGRPDKLEPRRFKTHDPTDIRVLSGNWGVSFLEVGFHGGHIPQLT